MSFLVLGSFRWNHYFIVFPVLTLLGPKKFLAKTDRVHENARFLPSWYKWCQALFAKNLFFSFPHLDDHLQNNTAFIGCLSLFPFCCFSFFCFPFSNTRMTKQNIQFSFRKSHFWHPNNFAKTLLGRAQIDTMCVFFLNVHKQHFWNKGKQWGKNLDQFLTYSLDQFLRHKPSNLGPVFNSTVHIYIYTHTYVLWVDRLAGFWPCLTWWLGQGWVDNLANHPKHWKCCVFFCKHLLLQCAKFPFSSGLFARKS